MGASMLISLAVLKARKQLVDFALLDGVILCGRDIERNPPSGPATRFPRSSSDPATCSVRNSSRSIPPSRFVRVLRLKPAAIL
jgi:hypothetical protein